MLLTRGIEPVTLMRMLGLFSVAGLELLGLVLRDRHRRRVDLVSGEQIEHFKRRSEASTTNGSSWSNAACASASTGSPRVVAGLDDSLSSAELLLAAARRLERWLDRELVHLPDRIPAFEVLEDLAKLSERARRSC